MNRHIKKIDFFEHVPLIGILIFVGLYIYAALLYPGGSQFDSNSQGFSFMHNYWCNLTNAKAINGLENPGGMLARAGMVILCISLGIFFLRFFQFGLKPSVWRSVLQVCTVLSLGSAIFIFTPLHDELTIVSSLFGLVMIIGVLILLFRSNWTRFKITGIICGIMVLINNYIYYSAQFLEYLPFIQKITFAAVLLWVIGLNYKISDFQSKKTPQHS